MMNSGDMIIALLLFCVTVYSFGVCSVNCVIVLQDSLTV